MLSPSRLLLSADRYKVMLAIAIPIFGAMVSQIILNLVDTALVGSLGTTALAAVGLGNFVSFMCAAFFIGLSSGVQALSARRKGEEQFSEMAIPLNGSLLFILVVALPFSLFLIAHTKNILSVISSDTNVIAMGTPYLQARLAGLVFTGMHMSFRGFFNGIGWSKRYMQTLIAVHIANVVISYTLIHGLFDMPSLGVLGAGIGTSSAIALGCLINGAYTFVKGRQYGFLKALPKWIKIKEMIRLSLPSAIQQFLFATGFTVLFWIIGQIGTHELAAANVLVNLIMIGVLPALSLGLTATTLVGQALGKRNVVDAKNWGWDTANTSFLLLIILGLPLVIFPNMLIGFFVQDPQTLTLAMWPLRLTGATMCLDGIGIVLANALLGAGDSRNVMITSFVIQWLVFLPLAWLLGTKLGLGLTIVWTAFILHRVGISITFVTIWSRGKWANIKI